MLCCRNTLSITVMTGSQMSKKISIDQKLGSTIGEKMKSSDTYPRTLYPTQSSLEGISKIMGFVSFTLQMSQVRLGILQF